MNSEDKKNLFNKSNIKWIIGITLWTFLLSIIFSIITENLVKNLGILISFIILLLIIVIGIFFDIIGIAVTKAEEKPFHSMAAKKINEAKLAIKLVRNAGPVSNFCNDVVGDISGIISGAVGTTLIYKLVSTYGFKDITLLSILITASTASLTVGGKAFGKSIGLIYYEEIVLSIARFMNLIEISFNIELFPDRKKSNKRY